MLIVRYDGKYIDEVQFVLIMNYVSIVIKITASMMTYVDGYVYNLSIDILYTMRLVYPIKLKCWQHFLHNRTVIILINVQKF